MPDNYIFAGNPGAGKSTLLNCMVGQVAFKSGVSLGSGLTSQLDVVTVDGVNYLDTPGLDDIEKRKKAAAAIEQALKQNGLYKILFVVTLEELRVRPADVQTMKCVLQACPVIGNNYGVILNKIDPAHVDMVNAGMSKLASCLFSGGVPSTVFVHVNPRDPDLAGKADVFKAPSPEMTRFLDMVPTITISPADVSELNVDNWDEQLEQLTSIIKKLEADSVAQREKMERQQDEFFEQLRNIEKRSEEARLFSERQLEIAREERAEDKKEERKRRAEDAEAAEAERKRRRLEVEEDKKERHAKEEKDRAERREDLKQAQEQSSQMLMNVQQVQKQHLESSQDMAKQNQEQQRTMQRTMQEDMQKQAQQNQEQQRRMHEDMQKQISAMGQQKQSGGGGGILGTVLGAVLPGLF